MPGSRRISGFGVPAVHGKFGLSTANYEPVSRVTGHESANFTSEFLYRCHAFVPYGGGFAIIIGTRYGKKAVEGSFSCAGLAIMGALLHDFVGQNVALLTVERVSYMNLRLRVRP